ncbi:hypothetical protein EQV77_14830 [Halobacillus fulvus]|nr:hypothetical protein EQV77_14830 [Halobacillus fulvus]
MAVSKRAKQLFSIVGKFMFLGFETPKSRLIYSIFILAMGTGVNLLVGAPTQPSVVYIIAMTLAYVFLIACMIKFAYETYSHSHKTE